MDGKVWVAVVKKNEPTTDDGDDWIDPDVNKRFGIAERPGAGCFVAVAVLIAVALLAYLILRSLT